MSQSNRQSKSLKKRRLQAGRLLLKGEMQAEVARRVKVSRTTVSKWAERVNEGGLAALEARPRGRPSGLDVEQRRTLTRTLKGGALAQGFATELWTLPRVGQLIKKQCGRRYSESQVWRILMSLGFSCQRPSSRALERNEGAIRIWKQKRWPALKKTPQNKGAQNKGESSSSSMNPD